MNWKVRIKNKYFWLALIPALILVIEAICKCFGLSVDLWDIQENLLEVINAVFALLAILGIVNDPTTAGLSDSKQALTYEEPKED